MAVVSSALTVNTAKAANTLYAPGDLVMFFQEQGGSNTVYINLGLATDFRGDASGPGGTPSINIANVGSTLTSAFGSGWQSNTNLYAGLAAVRSATAGSTVTNGDMKRTLYVSANRSALGNIYTQGSAAPTVGSDTDMTTAAGRIQSMNSAFDNGPDSMMSIVPTSGTFIDEQNPINAFGQGIALGVFAGGIQQQGGAGDMGSISSEGLGSIEFALDLYRISPASTGSGLVPGPTRQGTFEGSFVVGTNGSISFIPEPSSMALLGFASAALIFRRRRNA
jgi:hypothetical protein